MKKTIYFDFDGTLHDTAVIYQKSVQRAYNELRNKSNLQEYSIDINEASQWLGMTPKEMWQDFLPNLDVNLQEFASNIVGETMIQQLEMGQGKLYDKTIDTLKKLKDKGYHIKVLSNCKNIYGKTVMNVFKLYDYIDAFYCAESYDYMPKHQILNYLLAEDDVIGFVGDRKSDMDAGKFHNLFTVGCAYGFGKYSELGTADVIINNIEEVVMYFK